MDTMNLIIRSVLQGFYRAFPFLPPYIPLAILSFLTGAGMLWVFGKTSNPQRIRAAKQRLQAHLLEMRIYRDDPGVVWKAQKSLVAWNLRYLGLILRPAGLVALPLTLLLVHLEAFHGRAPLPLDRDAVVTLRMKSPVDANTPVPKIAAPAGIVAATPPVRVLGEQQISWRIRPVAETSGRLQFITGSETVEKEVEAGGGLRFVAGLRTSSLLESIWHPDEPRISSAAVDWIDITYPAAEMKILAIRLHWILWFTIFSMLVVILFRKRFGVVI
jgi:hypothetical protein